MPSASVSRKPVAKSRVEAPVVRPEAAVRPDAASRASAGDSQIVSRVLLVFVLCAAALASVGVARTLRTSRATNALRGTLERVHAQQQQYRMINHRFATWSELSSSGATLGPNQRVVASNADASHWFLAVRDRKVGVVCGSTGELFDEGPLERAPVCRQERR